MNIDYPIIPAERTDDLHNFELAELADLVLFMAGNQFMAMDEKRAKGTTLFTKVHHRETPDRIRENIVDVGPIWATETVHARETGLAFEVVEPGPTLDQRDRVNYYICGLKNGNNQKNGGKFLEFIRSAKTQGIYRKYGFVPLREG